jgi:phage terminase small subunit
VTRKAEPDWDAIEHDFALGPDHRMLVAAGRQAWRRWRAIAERIDADGLMIAGRYQGTDRVHPLLDAEIRARAALVSILNALGLPDEGGMVR